MLKLFAFAALVSAMCIHFSAQVASAELSGTVIDGTGASVPIAKVTATNVATNVAQETISGSTGSYIIPLLPPGEYVITVETTGFRKLIQKGLTLQINQQAQLDLTLQLGQVSESVEVSAQAPLIQSEASSLGTVVSEKLVNQLPLNGRNKKVLIDIHSSFRESGAWEPTHFRCFGSGGDSGLGALGLGRIITFIAHHCAQNWRFNSLQVPVRFQVFEIPLSASLSVGTAQWLSPTVGLTQACSHN